MLNNKRPRIRPALQTAEDEKMAAGSARAPVAEAAPAPEAKVGGKLTQQYGEPPLIITRDRGNTGSLLHRGALLGEGGFARVYGATEATDGTAKALKVISKEQLKTTKNRGKLFAEIKLHQAMSHQSIVRFEECFEDSINVYMVLEICPNGSLLDVLKKRKRYTEPEARFYLVQLIMACQYMHSRSVIHRDLKLGNLFLDANMDLKVGDFGLAALVRFPGERKKTICGTPNYIAPEILFDRDNGHSFEVDVWSIGVILYTFLVGKPPFQTKDVKTIYKKIKDNSYAFPPGINVSNEAVSLVSAILNTNPDQRPTLTDILSHEFFHPAFPFPRSIPPSASYCTPDFSNLTPSQSSANFRLATQQNIRSQEQEPAEEEQDVEMDPSNVSVKEVEVPAAAVKQVAKQQDAEVRHALAPDSPVSDLLSSARKPLVVSPARLALRAAAAEREKMALGGKENVKRSSSMKGLGSRVDQLRGTASVSDRPLSTANKAPAQATMAPPQRTSPARGRANLPPQQPAAAVPTPQQPQSKELYASCTRSLEAALSAQSLSAIAALTVVEDTSSPKVFITSWIDYTHKYGTAYQMTDGSSGVYFNDSTTMVLAPAKGHLDYISRKGAGYSRRNYRIGDEFPEDIERKVYLLKYFQEYMSQTLERQVEWTFVDEGRTKGMDFLVKYYRMKNSIVFKLSNDVLQINFFDHHKLLLASSANIVTFLGPDYKLRSYSLPSLMKDAHKLGLLTAPLGSPFFAQVPDEGSNPDPKRAKKQQSVSFMLQKLAYALEIVKGLSQKRQEAKAKAGEA